MGILDEAIREHLELKRQHGADDSELKQLEDEAFGSPERPGEEPTALESEAPTQFMAQPEGPPGQEGAATEAEASAEAPPRRERAAHVADLQEPPEAPERQEAERPTEAEGQAEAAAEEEQVAEQPAAESVTEEPVPSGPSTEERRAIAEQPTEMFDVEAEAAAAEPPAEPESAEPEEEDSFEEEEDEEFWSEQRLSDELDQALEAPIDLEPEAAQEEGHADDLEVEPQEEHEGEREAEPSAAAPRDEDVLEDTPEFLEESPEDDELWFEQKPPKDFDLGD